MAKNKMIQVSNRLSGSPFPEKLGFFVTGSFLQNLISQGIYLLEIKFCLHFATYLRISMVYSIPKLL